ncbi:MAG: cytochrome c [Beijerinckiaceae bacterium]|nr:cytochrome c [Beijerinckiaceae bacterium]
MRVPSLFVTFALLTFALPTTASRADTLSDRIADGEYLARAADCVACHTAPGGKPFAGGRAFALPFGVVYSPNITPDAETGIGRYSDDEWVDMLHKGVARDGKHLYPVMPYAEYTLMSREDALALKAYLMSREPVRATAPKNTLGFPFNQRWTMVFWNWFNNPNRRFVADQTKSAAYNRGDYLVNGPGHCGECHTPRTFMFGLKRSKAFAGEVQVGWRAYNLTSDKASGLGNWSDDQLFQYLSTGQAPGRGPASGPMAEAVEHSLSQLKADDVKAIVTYLRGVPALSDGPPAVSPEPAAASPDPLGARLFAQACAGCHLPSGSGRQSPWAALAGSHTAADPEGTNLVQVLTQGSELHTKDGLMFMHAFTGAYTDDELAAIANYTQERFGLKKGSISPAMIAKQRTANPDKPAKPSS